MSILIFIPTVIIIVLLLIVIAVSFVLAGTRDTIDINILKWQQEAASTNQQELNISNYDGELDQFCSVCKGPVEERTKHCGNCNRCTDEFDHHCFWLNTCIGKRNYRLFVKFVVTIFVYNGILIGITI